MKNKLRLPIFLLVAIITLLPQQSKAQYFAPLGAKWTYDYAPGAINSPPYTVEPLTIEIIKDTLINGLTCREAEIAISGVVQAKKYIRSINDSVLVYSSINNQFNLLYSFNVNIGDTLKIFTDGPWSGGVLAPSYVKIDSVGIKNLKGINYRAYHQSCLSNLGGCLEGSSGWVIDSLGVMSPYYAWPYIDKISYLFLAPIVGGPPNIYPLRCYTDSNTNYNYDNTNCDTTYLITNVENISIPSFNIYPTLLTKNEQLITIKTTSKLMPSQIKLYNLTGISIPVNIEKHETKTEIMLDNKIPSGIYLLNFTLNNIPFTNKIIIL